MKLPALIVVFVDKSLALIEIKQRKFGLPNLGVDFGATDFPASAEALGGVGRVVTNGDELREGIKGVFERQTFTLLACVIGDHAYDKRF